nr:immunoglobulin heavy chain junction region [Macaca mulatta]MOY21529.1 immunoglobulin heavy chain junction region [Macaca mulatta]MOY24117.1 immunoglobulin heavy chain junction region [Macaca mulatta]MOY24602.1 immunoglobulin heavy chain junction region [Macaca mulatta]MOY27363.1 immunoglobulin heavy chain junction region [Macaca mulatta]
CARRDENFDYW